MPSIPLKAQVGIRDHWKREDGPLQTTLRDLEGLIGHSVVIEPEWPLIVAELDSFYEDKNNLIAIVAGCVQAWAKSMMELLEDPAHADWTDTLLEKIPVRMRVFVDVAASASAATAWSDQRDGFVVSLPKKTVYQPAELFPVFRGGLLPCFEVKKKPQLPVRNAEAGASDDWEGVEVDATTGTAQVAQAPRASYAPAAARPKVEFLPNMASLPRPDQLFLQPPYHLSLIHGHHQIELHGSHSPTLELLAEYLKRWCRINHADTRNPPAVSVTLHQSPFGLGELFDRLTLNTETSYSNRFTVTAPMIISLIEGVLGYELIPNQSGWHFRRDHEFKTF